MVISPDIWVDFCAYQISQPRNDSTKCSTRRASLIWLWDIFVPWVMLLKEIKFCRKSVVHLHFISFQMGVIYFLTLNPNDDVIKWKRFHVTGPLCGEFAGHRCILLTKASDADLSFYLFCAWTNGSANHQNASDSRRHCALYHVTVMQQIEDEYSIVWAYCVTVHRYTSVWVCCIPCKS